MKFLGYFIRNIKDAFSLSDGCAGFEILSDVILGPIQ
jgi:hypothetical protein